MARELYERVNAAVQRGQVWRAKELLRGNIGSGSYDSPLYERYGRLLLDLGEAHEAGKYLFLSGRRRPEFDEAIKVYLSRHPQDRPEVLYYSFPSAARFRQSDRLPATRWRCAACSRSAVCRNTLPAWSRSGPSGLGARSSGCEAEQGMHRSRGRPHTRGCSGYSGCCSRGS